MSKNFSYEDALTPPNAGNAFSYEDATGEKPKEPGFAARLGQGASRALDSAKTALTDDPNKIAKIAADQARTALPQSDVQRKMAAEFAPYVDEANKAEGVIDNVKAWGAAGFKRAGQLVSNPGETAKMIAEQLPNSLPGIAGGFAGAKAGAALGSLAGPVGTAVGGVLGGVAGGFAGSYGLEKGAAMQDQVQKEAQAQRIDLQDESAVARMVALKQPEFDAAAQRKGVGTAGTDALLNVATMGLAGLGGRALAKEARALSDAVQAGKISAADASTTLARLQSENAARNTLGAQAKRGAGVAGAEMVGEGVSEGVGQKFAYGSVDAGEVIDESLMGIGTGGAMALGSKAFNKAAGIVNQDAITRDLEAAGQGLANLGTPSQYTGQPPQPGPVLGLPAPDRGVIEVASDGTARTPAYQAPGYVGDVTDVEPKVIDPVREQVAAAAEQGGALSSAALTAIDTGLSDAMQPAPEQAPPQISLEEADARDQAAYEQFFASHDSDPVVSRYFENDDDIPDFDAASNASEEDFLRALGATDEDIQDAIATSSQSAIPQSSAASNAGPQAYEPAGPREGAGEGAASQTGQVNAGAIQQAAPDAPVPGVGEPVGADGAGSAAAAVFGASGAGGAGTGAATGSGAGATEVGSARAGGRGDSNQALSAPTNLRDALVRVRQQKQEAANAQAAQAPVPAAAPVPGPTATAVEAAGLNRPKSARKAAEFDARKAAEIEAGALGAQEAEAAGVPTQVTWPAHRKWVYSQAPRMTLREFQVALKGRHGMSGSEIEAYYKSSNGGAEVSATKITTEGAANVPQASQAQQASPQPTQAAAPAAAAGLTDGAPAENTGAQAAPAPGAQGAAPAEPEFTTIKTVYGDSVTVRTADLNGDKQRLRQYTKDGKSKAVPAIHRDNLDLTGDKRKASAKEDADNPFFNVITTKDGSTFASQAAASRELNRLAMGETHEVVAASEAQDGAQGFVIRRKPVDAMAGRAETGGQQPAAPAAAELTLDEQLKQVNDQLANQGQVKNANTRAKRDQVRTAIAERDFPAILKAVDGDIDSAEAINQALQYAGDEPKAKVIERVLKNRGITDEYRQRWAERLMGEEGANNAVPAPSPGVVNVPPAIAEALDADTPAAAAAAAPAPKKKPNADKTRAKADLMAALADLGDILGKNTRMNIMPEQEQKLLPVLTRLLDAAFRLGYHKFKDSAKFALDQIRANLGDDAADALTLDHLQGAYIAMAGGKQGADTKRAVIDVETKAEIEAHTVVDPDAETDATIKPTMATADGRRAIAQTVADHMIGGNKFATINDARKFIEGITDSRIPPGTKQAKLADETVEVGVAIAARDIVSSGRKAGRTDEQIFNRLVSLYEAQPSLNVRDTDSLREQAYSTPAPLAFVASRLAKVSTTDKVGEPTGGNGMLLMEVAQQNAVVNELNDDRAGNLRAAGFEVTQNNAATSALAPAKSLDALVMNPPFGAVRDESGSTVTYTIRPEYSTGEIDHAIVFKSLESMKDDGNAVLIIGGTLAESEQGRKEAYRGRAKRQFFFNLQQQYNVVDHFTVGGDLYKKQGTTYPVDVIVIRGRGQSARALPAADLPPIITTWAQLQEKLNGNNDGMGASRPGITGSNPSANGNSPEQSAVLEPAGPTAQADGQGIQPAGSQDSVRADGAVQPDGAVPGRNPSATNDAVGQPGNEAQVDRTGRSGGIPGASATQQQTGANGTGERDAAGVGDGDSRSAGRARLSEEDAGKLQVKYQSFSGNKSVNTLVATNHLSALESAFDNLRKRVGNIDDYVRNSLQYSPEGFKKAFSAEQVEALALAIDNIERGRGFIIGDQTGIGKGRVVAAMIRYAKLNGKTPVFVTQMPDLYGDMMRDLNDIGMTDFKPLMTNNNAEVPLDAEALSWFGEVQAINTRVKELESAIEEILMGEGAADAGVKGVKASVNPEVVSLRDEIAELKASKPARTGKFLETPNIERHERDLAEFVKRGNIGDYGAIFTTYNQMAALDSGKPRRDKSGVKKDAAPPKFAYRNEFLQAMVNNNAMLILDESHNAGSAGDGKFPKVGDVVRLLVRKAGSVFYSSATFAKNPSVMDVYSKTDLGQAFTSADQLSAALSSVPQQQVASSMLVENGQYIRRERSFDGIEYKIQEVESDTQAAEDVSTAMRLVVEFDDAKKAAVNALKDDMDAQGATIAAAGGGGSLGSVDSTNFTSVMHNVINTFLLSLKADAAADVAIAAIKAGEKPVLTVANTMEMFIRDYAESAGLSAGDRLNATFGDVLMRYLEKTRKVRITGPNGDSETKILTAEELGPDGVAAYESAREFIASLNLEIPLSPIDHIKERIADAGYSIGEVTGRQSVVERGVIRPRNKAEMNTAGKKNTIAKFNGGQLDALIINRSGSTGLSMHASETFPDQRRRVMVVAQAELDINNHMQMLGRTNRTGQVTANGKSPAQNAIYGLPRYVQLTANVPIELRPAAVLAAKMASLSANTTAGRKSAVEDSSAPDFMNKYGDEVAALVVGNDPDLNKRLGNPISIDDTTGIPVTLNAISKVTGRIGLLPLREQKAIYDRITNEYRDLIAQLDALGKNDLEAKTYALDAKTLETTEVIAGDGDSVFNAPVIAEKVDVKKLGKPYSSEKVRQLVAESLGGLTPAQHRNQLMEDFRKEANAEVAAARLKAANEKNGDSVQKRMDALNAAFTRFRSVVPPLGSPVVIKTSGSGNIYGIPISIQRKKGNQSVGALSSWVVKYAVVDGARVMGFPLSQVFSTDNGKLTDSSVVVEPATVMNLPNEERTGFVEVPVLEAFDRGQTDSREVRYVMTGNLLRAGGKFSGRLISYTTADGDVRQGLLTPVTFDLKAAQAKMTPELTNPQQMVEFLDAGGQIVDRETGGDIVNVRKTHRYEVTTSKTGKGRKIAMEGGLYMASSGTRMRGNVLQQNAADLIPFFEKVVGTLNISLTTTPSTKDLVPGGASASFSRAPSATGNNGDFDPANPDIRRSFAGASAATADKHALVTAQDRLSAGEDAETVRQETGWFQGKDGKWRFEISDADAKLKDRAQWATQRDALQAKSEAALQSKWAAQEARNAWLRQRGESPSRISSESKKNAEFKALAAALKKAEATLDKARQAQEMAGRDGAGMTVGSLLDHPALFAAYPGIADVRVELRDGLPANNASYTHEGRSIDLSAHSTDAQLLSTLLHEIQHGIQNIEGFASGGPSGERMWLGDMRPIAMAEYQKLIAEINRPMSLEEYARQAWGVDSVTDEIRQDYAQNFVPSHMAALERKGLDGDLQRTAGWLAYRRLAGEVEARNTQARQGMTDAQRRATPPNQTADVADADVIVVFNGKEMANAPMPANAAPDAATTAQPLRTPAATIRAAITKAYGKLLGQLESKGLVTLTQTEDEAIEAAAQARAAKTGGDVEAIKRSMINAMQGETDLDVKRSANGAIQGFFDPQTGQSFLIADNLTAEAAPGVLMHEVGIHMAADGSMNALFNRAAMMLKLQRGNPFMKAVQDRMDAAGETSGEEAAAYIAEAYENDRANAPASVQRWLADLLAAVKAWMFKKGIMGADRLTVADIAAVARANARSMARDGGATGGQGFGTAFSRAPAGDQTQTDAFKRWFAGSRVVDDDGKPMVVYHGTHSSFTEFKPNDALGGGMFFSPSPEEAGAFTGATGSNIMPVYLSAQKVWPKIVRSYDEVKAIRAAKSKGYDAIRVRDDQNGVVNWVVFDPTQVKSATGNNGDFDPANPDIRFSRTTDAAKAVGDTLKSITVSNVKQRAGFKLTDYLGIGLQALGRRQIVDIYGDLVPLAEYNRLVQQMEADKNEGSAEADQLVTRWAKLDDEAKLADLMHDATLAQIDPAKPYVDGDDKARYMTLQGRFNALTDAAKQVYTDTRDSYQAHHAKVRSAIKERIERSEIKGERKAALLKQMDDEFFKAVKGVYFPLARFGQYAVTVKGPDGKVESVSRAETKAEAEALRNNLLTAFPRDKGFTVGRVMLSKDFIADRDAVGRGFMTELYQVLDKQDMDAVQRAELEDTLGQLYLSSLPDLSWAKHGIHRKGTPGFSQDARRAFAQNMFHGARYLAKLRYSDLMQDELAAMQKHVDDWREVEGFDQNSAQRVVDEMNKRHESLMNPKSNALSTALTSFGFIFHLGLSPASAMVNLSQTALVAYPIMGAKWGFNKASAALLKASAEAAKGKNDITGSLNADERAAYDEAVRAGTIDVTMAHDLAGIAQGEDAGVMWKLRPVMRWASFFFHHAERFNRQVTFVAAYRLAREAGADQKAAFEQATKATYDGHFDYGAANRPRIMQGNVAKVLLLFKQYGQNMVYTLSRNAYQSINGTDAEKAEARKVLAGLLTSHAMAAGVLGLPMVTTLLAAASMIGGDDDEPRDAKVALQNLLADTFGQKPAEVLAHGLSRLTPWDISGRVGLDRLIFPDVQEGLEGQRLAESAMAAALGPVAGIGVNMLKGAQYMSEGRYALGLEAMLPSALRGPVKAIRYANEGVQDKSGISILDEVSPAAVAGQALGFSPSQARNAQEGKSAVMAHDRALGERRQELLTKAARASMAKDAEALDDARKEIARFNEKNPTRRITPLNVLQSVRNRQKRIDQAEDGVYLPRNRRDAMDAGRFANAD